MSPRERSAIRIYTCGAEGFNDPLQSFFVQVTDTDQHMGTGMPLLSPGTPESTATAVINRLKDLGLKKSFESLDEVAVQNVLEALGKVGLARFEIPGLVYRLRDNKGLRGTQI